MSDWETGNVLCKKGPRKANGIGISLIVPANDKKPIDYGLGRKCKKCGAELSRYNPGKVCMYFCLPSKVLV